LNIVTPSFRLELTPIAGASEAPQSGRPGADSAFESEGAAPGVPGAAAGTDRAVALGAAATAPPGKPPDARETAAGGWVRVRVRAGICGFRADFEARTQRESLGRFERELGALQDAPARAGRAEFACDEPGIDLRLEARDAGPIAGHFALESERRGGAWTTLSGTFELEPEALPGIRASIVALLRTLEE